MNRRELLFSIGSGIAASILSDPAWAVESEIPMRTKLGIDDFSYNIRSRAEKAGFRPKVTQAPLTFLKHCRSIGAGGLQCAIGRRDQAYAKKLRAYIEDNDMFMEDSVWLGDKVDLDGFGAGVASVKAAGARAIRGFCGGRRYEQFDKREQFDEFADRSWKAIEPVAPIVEKYRMPLAIENHKDRLIPHMSKMLRKIDSGYVGVCIDTNNSFALLEDQNVKKCLRYAAEHLNL